MRWQGILCQTRPHHFCYRAICGSPVLWVQAPNPCLRASMCGLHLLPGLLSLCALPHSLSSSWPGFFSSLGHTSPTLALHCASPVSLLCRQGGQALGGCVLWAWLSLLSPKYLQPQASFLWFASSVLEQLPGEMPPGQPGHPTCFCRRPVHGQRGPQHQRLPVLHLHHKDRLVSCWLLVQALWVAGVALSWRGRIV